MSCVEIILLANFMPHGVIVENLCYKLSPIKDLMGSHLSRAPLLLLFTRIFLIRRRLYRVEGASNHYSINSPRLNGRDSAWSVHFSANNIIFVVGFSVNRNFLSSLFCELLDFKWRGDENAKEIEFNKDRKRKSTFFKHSKHDSIPKISAAWWFNVI